MNLSTTQEKLPVSPLQTIGPVATSFIVPRLPIMGILKFALRSTLSLIRPTLIILGVIKAYDLIGKARNNKG